MRELTLWNVGQLLGVKLPRPGQKSKCPFRKHKRRDKTFRVYRSRKSGDELWKCWSCDAPENVGDAVSFYARFTGLERGDAYRDLMRKGFDLPGYDPNKDRGAAHRTYNRRPKGPPPIPVEGTSQGPFLRMDMDKWRVWKSACNGAVSRYAQDRSLDTDVLRLHDVVDVDSRCVGFGYRDPETGLPCRVKIRPVDRKTFWIEPRGSDGESRAKGPLYLAHDLEVNLGQQEAVIITEGETDALSLRQLGYRNVVSLPDGAESAATVSVEPIAEGFQVWLVSTDNDEEGHRAYQTLRKRGRKLGVDVVRLIWGALIKDETGDEVVEFKDANDALQAGFDRKDFDHCIERATETFLGYPMKAR